MMASKLSASISKSPPVLLRFYSEHPNLSQRYHIMKWKFPSKPEEIIPELRLINFLVNSKLAACAVDWRNRNPVFQCIKCRERVEFAITLGPHNFDQDP